MTRRSTCRCCQCCEMLLLCCFTLLLCLCINAEDVAMCREPGENVTLGCSLAGCARATVGYIGMYLYNHFKSQKEEVLYYHSMNGADKVSERKKYQNRIEKAGSLENHSITISNLAVHDSGVYSCVYKKAAREETRCNVYALVVRGADAPASPEVPSASPPNTDVRACPPLAAVASATALVSLLLAVICIRVLVPRVKQWTSSSRRARNGSLDPSDVYEDMTTSRLQPVAAPEQPPPSPYKAA